MPMKKVLSTISGVISLLCIHFVYPAEGNYECKSPQSLEVGKRGLVECVFPTTFYAIYWFNTTNVLEQDAPLVSLQRSTKGNPEYRTKGYDISSNGSLIIQEVTFSHETTYASIFLETQQDPPVASYVDVKVIDKPSAVFPEISRCQGRICLGNLKESPNRTCNVGKSRPPISLVWKIRTPYGDEAIAPLQNRTTTISFDKLFDSHKIWFSSSLSLLVCQIENNPFNFRYNTSLLVLQNRLVDTDSLTYKTVVFAKGETLVLPCAFYNGGVVLWKRATSADGKYRPIAYAGTGTETFEVVVDSDYGLFTNKIGSLMVPNANFSHGGFYLCISSSTEYQHSDLYEAVCIIPPSTPYPIIQGCNDTRRICELPFDESTGVVVCSVNDVFPKLELEIRTVLETDRERITFYNRQTTITEHGGSYNITLESHFRVTSTTTKEVVIMCHTVDAPHRRLDAESQIVLRFPRDLDTDQLKNISHEKINRTQTISLVLLLIAVVLILIVLFLLYRSKAKIVPVISSIRRRISIRRSNDEERHFNQTARSDRGNRRDRRRIDEEVPLQEVPLSQTGGAHNSSRMMGPSRNNRYTANW